MITHGAFEYLCVQTKIHPGDIINSDPVVSNIWNYHREDSGYYSVQTKSYTLIRNTDTGENITFPEGSFAINGRNDVDIPTGRYEIIVDHYYETFCFSPYLNAHSLPLKDKFEPFKLMEGEEIIVPVGTRIFMMEGAVNIADKNYTNVNRLKFTTASKKVRALRNTYGVYVK